MVGTNLKEVEGGEDEVENEQEERREVEEEIKKQVGVEEKKQGAEVREVEGR